MGMIFRLALLSALISSGAPCAAEWKLVWSHEFQGQGDSEPEKWRSKSGVIENKERQFSSIAWDTEHFYFAFDLSCYETFRFAKADTPEGHPFRKPHNLIPNLAFGGNSDNQIDDSIFPVPSLIDSVCAYQKH